MGRVLKFVHVVGAIGLIGSMACLLVLMGAMPGPGELAGYASVSRGMGAIATWVFFPSLGLTLLGGLMAIAFNRGFQNAGWAWLKLATGVLIFEGGFVSVLGPLQREAEQSARVVAGVADASTLAGSMDTQRHTVWVLLAIGTVNVVLGIWRPRLGRRTSG